MPSAKGWGLLNLLAVPEWLAILVAFVLLDLVIYAQHVLFHANPLLWRLHRMHHSDIEIDVTTGVRFHPLEILLSMVIKLGAVVVLGAPAVAVMIFEVLLNATAMFSHGNIRLPARVDRWLRRVAGDARHAPRPPFDRAARDAVQFRLQPAVVGPFVRHLSRPARGGA